MGKQKGLTSIAEAFAQNRAKGMKPRQAYIEAAKNSEFSENPRAIQQKVRVLKADPMVNERIAELRGCLEEWRAQAANNLIAQTEDLQAFLTGIVADTRDEFSTGDRLKAADMLMRTHGAYKERIEANISAQATMTYEERKHTLIEILQSNGNVIDVPSKETSDEGA